jgi:predicted ATPase
MAGSAQPSFRTTALDPTGLAKPFSVRTRWHVITGAPSCGKTTLIDLLDAAGLPTVPETARSFMAREVARGRTLDEIHADGAALQRSLAALQLAAERGLAATEVLFLDGAVPSSLAWYRLFGLDPNEMLPDCFHHRYASVFILDRLPLQLDGFRFQDDAYAGFLDEWQERDYRALGYRVVRVPVLPPEERLAFVLDTLAARGQMIEDGRSLRRSRSRARASVPTIRPAVRRAGR